MLRSGIADMQLRQCPVISSTRVSVCCHFLRAGRLHRSATKTVKQGPAWPCRGASQLSSCHPDDSSEERICTGNGGHGGSVGGGGGEGFRRWWNSEDGSSPGFRLLCILLASQAWEAQAAGRRRGTNQRNPWDRNQDIDQYATHLTQLGWPLVQNLGFSGAVGLVCAVAFKAIGRVVAVTLGTGFLIIQLLAYRGYITVQWSRIHEEVLRICDVDQDGRFEATDMRTALASVLAAASQGLPSISGFCLGFGLGLRF